MSQDIHPVPDSHLQPQRWHDLDAVRAFALLSGVALHGVMSFMQPRIWMVADPRTSTGADVLFYVIHIFRMTLFFVLAGFFARLMMQKKGVAGFVGNRLKRVALPLVAFWPLIMVSIVVMLIVANAPAPGAAAAPLPPPPPLSVATFPLTHLWFLYVLLLFYAAAVVTRLVTDVLHIGGALGRLLDSVFGVLTRWDLVTGLLVVPVFLAFVTNTSWMMWFGIATPDTGLIPNAMALAGFGTAFVFGWWLHRQPGLLDHLAGRCWLYGFAAAAGTWLCLAMIGQTPVLTPADGRDHLLYALVYPLTSWSWAFALIGAARLTLRGEHPLVRRLSDASYWIYIIHIPVVLVLQWLMMKVELDVVGKFCVVLFGTLFAGLLSYPLIVRYSFIGTILNGRKRKAKPAAFAEEATA